MSAVIDGGGSLLPPGRKTRALLAILAAAAPKPLGRPRLAELLWSRRPEEQARASLRQEIHRLLEALQPAGIDILRVARDHLSLRTGLIWIDVEELNRATAADPSALALFDDEMLEEFDGIDPAFDRWLVAERNRLRSRARTLAETVLREQNTPDGVIPAAQRLLAIDRADEGAWRALMAAHAERGDRNLALQSFDRCKAALEELLQAAPSPETQIMAAQIRTGAAAPLPSVGAEPAAAADRPVRRGAAKVGVLPLGMIGAGPEEAHLSLGLAEEVTAALARFRQLFLVSSSSLAGAADRGEAAIRRQFGLDFLLDGSLQRDRRRLRVTMRLLDLREGNRIVWARRFDRETDDPFSLQDEIAAEVVAQIDREILQVEGRHAAQRPPGDVSAFDLVVRAMPMLPRLQRDEFLEAGELLAQAVSLDPDYAAAHAWRASWAMFCVEQGWTNGRATAEQAEFHAERAIILDPQDAKNLTVAGHVRALLHHRPREALELHGRALSLNPNLAMAWGFSALACTFIGEADEAARRYARYERLTPTDPYGFVFDAGAALLELGRRDNAAALRLARRACELNPHYVGAAAVYLSALGHAGRAMEAAPVRDRLLAAVPGFSVAAALRRCPLTQPAAAHYAEGLRRACVPEAQADSLPEVLPVVAYPPAA